MRTPVFCPRCGQVGTGPYLRPGGNGYNGYYIQHTRDKDGKVLRTSKGARVAKGCYLTKDMLSRFQHPELPDVFNDQVSEKQLFVPGGEEVYLVIGTLIRRKGKEHWYRLARMPATPVIAKEPTPRAVS
jgi:hypothetical protein